MENRTTKQVLLDAADLVEQEKYCFSAVEVPKSCQDAGCVLGWIGYCKGMLGEPVLDVAKAIGYSGSMIFYTDMSEISPFWQHNPEKAARNLRILAERF